jgi:arylsulfatase
MPCLFSNTHHTMLLARAYVFSLIAIGLMGSHGMSEAAAAPKPNMVVILADDMGYSDPGCYGSEIPTPVLDGLASNGLRFTRFYNAARCCPTRASLLTGLHPHQAGIGHMVDDSGMPGYRGRLGDQCVTLAEVLRSAGYQTFMTGKWHVTTNPYSAEKAEMDPDTWPLQRGFDRFYGTLAGGGNYFSPVSLMRDNKALDPPKADSYYFTDAISDEAASYIREAKPGQPLFLYLAFTAPHWPLHAPEEEIQKHLDAYRAGWDEIRSQRHQRMIKAGLLDEKCPLSPRGKAIPAWQDAKHKEWEIRRMATHAAMVSIMDRGIGRVIDALKHSGRFDNTLVMFLSDNGASRELIQGKEGRHGAFPRGGTKPGIMPGPADTYASFGPQWANVCNTPFRLYKKDTHEGGTATPLVVHWPQGISARGELRHQPGHVMDLMPTVVALSGADYPLRRKSVEVTPMQGISLVSAFRGETLPDRPLFFEHEGNRAVRLGHWTLVAGHGKAWQLYDVSRDRTETNNLSAKMPEKVAELETLYQAWAARSNVAPWPLKRRQFQE